MSRAPPIIFRAIAALGKVVLSPAQEGYRSLADLLEPYASRPELIEAALSREPTIDLSHDATALKTLEALRANARGLPKRILAAFDEVYAPQIAILEEKVADQDSSALRDGLNEHLPKTVPVVIAYAEKGAGTSGYVVLPNDGDSSFLDVTIVRHLTGMAKLERRSNKSGGLAFHQAAYAVFVERSVQDAVSYAQGQACSEVLTGVKVQPHVYLPGVGGRCAPRRVNGSPPPRGKVRYELESGAAVELSKADEGLYFAFRQVAGKDRKPVYCDDDANRRLIGLAGKDPEAYARAKEVSWALARPIRNLVNAGALKRTADRTYEVMF